jgi:UrcA family protein
MSTRTLFAVAAIAAALQFAGSAQAAPACPPPADEISVRVPVADLDLRQAADAKIALQRVHRAAVIVCGGEPPLYNGLAHHAHFKGCVKTAVRNAVSLAGAQMASDPNAGSSLLEMVLAANP